jgi:hypothetical protein
MPCAEYHRPNPLILPLAAAVLKNGWEAVEKGKRTPITTSRRAHLHGTSVLEDRAAFGDFHRVREIPAPVHYASRRRGGVAARGARATTQGADNRGSRGRGFRFAGILAAGIALVPRPYQRS